MADYKSPNGTAIVGTSDTIPATALINGIYDDGTPSYEGNSNVDWDSQKTKTRDGKILYIDEDGKEWTFDQLVKVEVEEDGDDE